MYHQISWNLRWIFRTDPDNGETNPMDNMGNIKCQDSEGGCSDNGGMGNCIGYSGGKYDYEQ